MYSAGQIATQYLLREEYTIFLKKLPLGKIQELFKCALDEDSYDSIDNFFSKPKKCLKFLKYLSLRNGGFFKQTQHLRMREMLRKSRFNKITQTDTFQKTKMPNVETQERIVKRL